MTRLAALRSSLRRLLRRRRRVRRRIGTSALVIAVVWLLAGLFLADWLMEMNRAQRAVTMVVAAGVLVWAVRRFTLPWLGHRESMIDMALLVQRQHKIDSDLVAALQFESPDAYRWGSVQMEQAVIDRAIEESRSLHLDVGLPRKVLVRRAMILAVTAIALAAAIWQFPDYTSVFFNRLLLSSQHYPSRTRIESVAINGKTLESTGWGQEEVKCPYGQPVRFTVTCAGELPSEGQAKVRTESGGLETGVTLSATGEPGVYTGELARLVDAATCQLYMADAWTDPVRLVVVPPAAVDVEFEVTAPSYASVPATTETISGLRQLAVAEGSRVVPRVTADKELREATIAIGGTKFPLARQGEPLGQGGQGAKELWVLDPKDTPLSAVSEPLRYVIQVTDIHGLQLERPIEGVIRVKVDYPPQIFGNVLTQMVLPNARPTVTYTASDDHGLAQVAILAEVVHADGTSGEKTEQVIYKIPEGETARKNLQDKYRLNLAPLKAAKGDQVKVTLRAVDYRGAQAGRPALSDPLLFQVTDERGIYAAMAEADQESARQLNAIIEQQIDVGEGK